MKDLTVICNTPAGGPTAVTVLCAKKQVRKLVCSYVGSPSIPTEMSEQVKAGEVECEMVPQGMLIERVRAGGAGLAGFYTPTGVGTEIAKGKEERVFDGKPFIFERALRADSCAAAGAPCRHRRQPSTAAACATSTSVRDGRAHHNRRGEGDPPLGPAIRAVGTGYFRRPHRRGDDGLNVSILRQILMSVGRAAAWRAAPSAMAVRRLPPDLMAMAALLRPGEYVNPASAPTLVSNFIAERDITLHSENGILGFGPCPGRREHRSL